MLHLLPSKIRLKLDHTLAQWPQWNCAPVVTRAPTIVKALTSGVSNYNILVESEQQFVVRIDGFKPSTFGLCRETEWRTLGDAYKAGLTPRPCYFNPDLGSLVWDYLKPDSAQGLNVADIARVLHRIHKLPPRHHRLNLADRIARYEHRLKRMGRAPSKGFAKHRKKVTRLLNAISNDPGESVLCHNNLLRADRVYSEGKLWAIGWEYCAMGSPWYDIATVINGDGLSAEQADDLLHAYLGRAPNDWERETLHRYGCIYRYLELLWYKALEKPMLDTLTMERKTAAFTTMLGQVSR